MELLYIVLGSACTLGGLLVADFVRYGREKKKEIVEAYARLHTLEDILLIELRKYFKLAAESSHQEKISAHQSHFISIIGKLENYLNQSYHIGILESEAKAQKNLQSSRELIQQFYSWFADLESHIQKHLTERSKISEFELKIQQLEKSKNEATEANQKEVDKAIVKTKEIIAHIEEWDRNCEYLSPILLQDIAKRIEDFQKLCTLLRK
jgi:hypothetical protein